MKDFEDIDNCYYHFQSRYVKIEESCLNNLNKYQDSIQFLLEKFQEKLFFLFI